MSYTPEIRSRLAKALGLMASDQDGEALAAARAAQRLMATAGLQWADVLAQPGAVATPAKPRSAYRVHHPKGAMPPLDPPRNTWRETLQAVATAQGANAAQRGYVQGLLRAGYTSDPDWTPATYAMASAICRMHADTFEGGKAA